MQKLKLHRPRFVFKSHLSEANIRSQKSISQTEFKRAIDSDHSKIYAFFIKRFGPNLGKNMVKYYTPYDAYNMYEELVNGIGERNSKAIIRGLGIKGTGLGNAHQLMKKTGNRLLSDMLMQYGLKKTVDLFFYRYRHKKAGETRSNAPEENIVKLITHFGLDMVMQVAQKHPWEFDRISGFGHDPTRYQLFIELKETGKFTKPWEKPQKLLDWKTRKALK